MLLAALSALAVAGASAAQAQAPGASAPPIPPGATHVQETGKAPDGPPSLGAAAYDSRIRSSFASAEAFQGPLDGAWTLGLRGAGDIYTFQLSDHGHGVEGAWRDLRRPGATDASGLIDSVQADADALTVRFADATAVLHSGGGTWSGELTQGGRRRAVTLRRTGP
jgi:hypothetical protein